MAKTSVASPTPAKPRAAARTIEQQIADLQAKAEAKKAKVTTKASKELAAVEAKITAAETKLAELYAQRSALRETLGLQVPDPEVVADPEPAEV